MVLRSSDRQTTQSMLEDDACGGVGEGEGEGGVSSSSLFVRSMQFSIMLCAIASSTISSSDTDESRMVSPLIFSPLMDVHFWLPCSVIERPRTLKKRLVAA